MKLHNWRIISGGIILLCGCTTLINRYCLYPHYAPEAIEQASSEVSPPGKLDPTQARSVHIYFPYAFRPQITEAHFTTEQDPENPSLSREVYSLDGRNYKSLQALVDELDRRRPQLMEAGIFCPSSAGKRLGQEELQGNRIIYEYCRDHDIDLFTNFPLNLPSLDNLSNVYWTLQSTQTKYVLPAATFFQHSSRYPAPLHPNIPRIFISGESGSEGSSQSRVLYTLEEKSYDSLEAIRIELERRNPSVAETGIWYSTRNSCPPEAASGTDQFFKNYCLHNDIDLFEGMERDLDSTPDSPFVTWWRIGSSKTKYQLPEEPRKRRKRSRVQEPMADRLLKAIPPSESNNK